MKLELSKEAREKIVVAQLAGRQVRTFLYSRDSSGKEATLGAYPGIYIPDFERLHSKSVVGWDGERFTQGPEVLAKVCIQEPNGRLVIVAQFIFVVDGNAND